MFVITYMLVLLYKLFFVFSLKPVTQQVADISHEGPAQQKRTTHPGKQNKQTL